MPLLNKYLFHDIVSPILVSKGEMLGGKSRFISTENNNTIIRGRNYVRVQVGWEIIRNEKSHGSEDGGDIKIFYGFLGGISTRRIII